MIQLSAVIITFNEEEHLTACIKSLQGIVDEIIVLDSQSTDRTAEICKNLGVQFHCRPFEGYSEAKNYANSLAKHDFILSIDADEQISAKLSEEILKFISTAKESDLASFNRLTNYCGKWIKHGGWYPDVKIRIFNKKFVYWQGKVHERLKLDPRSRVKHIKGDLLHYSFHSVEEHKNKIELYSQLAAQESFSKKIKPSWIKLFFGALFKFTSTYFIRAGFLDGKAGFQIASLSAYGSYLKQRKLIRLYQNAGITGLNPNGSST